MLSPLASRSRAVPIERLPTTALASTADPSGVARKTPAISAPSTSAVAVASPSSISS